MDNKDKNVYKSKDSFNGNKNSDKKHQNHKQNIPYRHKQINETNLGELIKNEADEVAKNIAEYTSYTQTRKFYDALIQLQDRAKSLDDVRFKIEILPHVFLVKAQVTYSHGRGNSNQYFSNFIANNIDDIEDKDSLKRFILYFEAVLGYLKFYKEK